MKKSSWYIKVVIKGFLAIVFILVFIFGLAGRWDYWQGWMFSMACIVLYLVSIYLFREKLDLGKERLKPGPGMKWWDKLYFILTTPLYIVLIVIAPLDAGRFLWTKSLPLSVYIVGFLMFLLAMLMAQWAKYVNKFFSSVVRIQKDRKQTVVQSGPYQYIRHPGYLGGVFLGFGISLALGSLHGLIPAFLLAVLIIMRTFLEDRCLYKELAGYKEYTKKVKYRLVPGIW
ncbi:methyltransferase family protein [Patescibacteria group bacterium]